MRIYNIGYQGKSLASFCSLLLDRGVQTLVDVRARAWSQRPDFRKTKLAGALADAGITYVHLKTAGNPFRPKPGEVQDAALCSGLYQQHLDEHPEILDELAALERDGDVAVMCFEAERMQCHRGVLLRDLAAVQKRLKVIDV